MKAKKLTDRIHWAGERWAGCWWGEDRASSACRQSSGQVLPLTQSKDHLTLDWFHSSVATHTHTHQNVFIAAHLYFTPLHSISETSSVRKKWQRNFKKEKKLWLTQGHETLKVEQLVERSSRKKTPLITDWLVKMISDVGFLCHALHWLLWIKLKRCRILNCTV